MTPHFAELFLFTFIVIPDRMYHISLGEGATAMPEVILTPNQHGRFEHHIKIGMIETLHKKGLLSDLVFMEAVRIQNEKDKFFFDADYSNGNK